MLYVQKKASRADKRFELDGNVLGDFVCARKQFAFGVFIFKARNIGAPRFICLSAQGNKKIEQKFNRVEHVAGNFHLINPPHHFRKT